MDARFIFRSTLLALLVYGYMIGNGALAATLPQEHAYQQELRKFLGSLSEKDYHVDFELPKAVPLGDDLDELYRMWLLTFELPRVGAKRSAPSVQLPGSHFTLKAIESEKGIIRPAAWSEPLVWLANWKYAGNPYYGSRAIKLRAFVTAVVDMLQMDDMQEHSDHGGVKRSDWVGPHVVMYAYTYAGCRDVLPKDAQQAFEAGLKKMLLRLNTWGPKGEETHFDIQVPLAMYLAAKASGDVELMKVAEDYTRRLLADERFYHPAGYFVDNGCFDAGFQGMSLYFATWLANASDWKFFDDVVAKALKLRSYMAMPDPDGKFYGPSHMNSRTSSDAFHDQWDFPFRYYAGAQITDDAASGTKFPTREEMQETVARVVGFLGAQLKETPGAQKPEQMASSPWAWRLWPNSHQFPMNNFAFDYYPVGYYAHRAKLEEQKSPLLKYPFQREGTFLETFEKAIVAAKKPNYSVILHTGPVSEYKDVGIAKYNGPYGLGGGCISAFGTEKSGTVLLGRRGGMAIRGPEAITFDKPEAWRTWPIHAVSGAVADGRFFTSARIQRPDVAYNIDKNKAEVKVSGTIPAITMGEEKVLKGKLEYSRTFLIGENDLSVTSNFKSDGQDKITELYETLPVFLGEPSSRVTTPATKIEFQVGEAWAAATDEPQDRVMAIRLQRFDGAVLIKFDKAQRVKLSPADWKDTYLSKVQCRNVLIDLMPQDSVGGPVAVSYRIAAEK